MPPNIGTAGWNIPRDLADQFPLEGSALTRYATRFGVAEINSSFHRPHRRSTWERWRDSVPETFRFSVKIPKLVTHSHKLSECSALVDEFVAQASALGEKLAVLLVQLPPKLDFNEAVATEFFRFLCSRTHAKIACEPRHSSWFTSDANTLLEELAIGRVGADPAICEAAGHPGDWSRLSYWRLHGSPVKYRSSYLDRIEGYAMQLREEISAGREVWCIFDNTASTAGTGDALALAQVMSTEDD